MKLQLARLIKNICYAAGCASAVLSLALKSAPQTAQRWLLFGGIALLVLGFLVSVTFYRCPHCHRVLPANRGKMDDCPYCKLPSAGYEMTARITIPPQVQALLRS